jgi:ribose-phosphate pyrophosphokinase
MSCLFAGSSHISLAQAVAKKCKSSLGSISLTTFPDGELSVKIEEELRGKQVALLQSLSGKPSEYLLQLLLMIDACRRAAAAKILVVIPYLGYSRQDRRDTPGTPISAKLIATLLETAGATELITFDLHADQIEGFFNIPVTHLHAQPLLIEAAHPFLSKQSVVVAPDMGSVKIAETAAKSLGLDLALMKKERMNPFDVKTSLIGTVKGKTVFLIDDLSCTGTTLVSAAALCHKSGAKKIIAAVTHGLFTPEALEQIEASKLDRVITTDTAPFTVPHPAKLTAVSVAPLLAKELKQRGF